VRGLVATLLANASAAGHEDELGREHTPLGSDNRKASEPLQRHSSSTGNWIGVQQQQPAAGGEHATAQQRQGAGGANVPATGRAAAAQQCGVASLLRDGCMGTDLVWWDAVQPKLAMADASLAR
jgi:hypothetical protein